LDEKLRWTFSLYDINGDGCITREEMTDIVTAIYELMGKFTEPCVDESTVKEKVDHIFQVNILWPHKYLDSFNVLLILPAVLCPGVHSASNRNEYQKQENVSGE
jgi:hypothetical protein